MTCSLTELDRQELQVLFDRKNQIPFDIDYHKKKIEELKNEWHELSDANLGKDYKVSDSVIWHFRNGKTYQCTAQ